MNVQKGSVYIVGGGPSLKGFDFNLLKNKDVIAVNCAVDQVPWAKYFITMDYALFNVYPRTKIEQFTGKRYFISNMVPPYMIVQDGKIMDSRNQLCFDLGCFDDVIFSYDEAGIGFNWNDFRNGHNSGYSALQLAVLLGYKQIHLLGIDLCIGKEIHCHKRYEPGRQKWFVRALPKYVDFFRAALRVLEDTDIHIRSYCKGSPLNDIITCSSLDEIKQH